MSTHTPTPWRINHYQEVVAPADDGDVIVRIAPSFMFSGSQEGKDNAAFIVKACNSHDILINALHAVVNGLGAVKNAGEKADGVGQLLNALDEAARAALAAAGTE